MNCPLQQRRPPFILLAHVALIALLNRDDIPLHRLRPTAEPMIADIAPPAEQAATNENPALSFSEAPVQLPMPTLSVEAFEPQRDAPQIDPNRRPDIASFSARAHLAPGTVATVLLMLEIAADGSVISAEVVRSNADEAATAAAVDYARSTRWTPGMIDGEPSNMQASLTVVLGENG